MLEEIEYQESIISEILKRIANNYSLYQSQKQAQATVILDEKIGISISLSKVKGTSGKLQCIMRYQKIRSTLYTGNTLCKLLCKSKDPVAAEDKNVV